MEGEVMAWFDLGLLSLHSLSDRVNGEGKSVRMHATKSCGYVQL